MTLDETYGSKKTKGTEFSTKTTKVVRTHSMTFFF